MLDYMRAAANTWVAKALLIVLLLSFASWGIPHAFYGQSGNTIYQSDKTSGTVDDYYFIARNEATKYLFETNQFISPDQYVRVGLARQVLQQLKNFVLLDEEARRMKINTGEKGTLQLLGKDKTFQVVEGKFSKDKFLQFIQQAQFDQKTYIDQLKKTATRSQIIAAVTENIEMPDVFYSALALSNGELRNIEYISVTPSLINPLSDPDQDTLASWYEANKADFRAPEYRKATYVTLTTKSQLNPAEITEEALKAEYEKTIDTFSSPEMRDIDELRFGTRKEADEAAEKLKNGMTFDDLVVSLKQDIDTIRKTSVKRTDLPSLVAPAVFNVKEGDVSAVINDLQGPIIVRVVKVIPSQAIAFEEVSSQIREKLALQKAQQKVSDLAKVIGEEQYSGLSLVEIAKKYNLPIVTVTIDAQGNDMQGNKVESIPNQDNLIRGIFAATVGIDSDPFTSDNGVQWYQADEIIASRDRNIDEVRQKVIEAWKKQEIQRLVAQKAESLNTELSQGKNLEQIAHENKVKVEKATALTRLGTGGDFSQEALAVIFKGPDNSTGIAPGDDQQTKLVFKVISTAEPLNISPDSMNLETKRQLSLSLRQDVFSQYLLAVESEHAIQVNAAKIQSILNQ